MKLKWINNHIISNVAILGDVILDEYWEGSVTRISPEAPVPVVWIHQSRHNPGGAANTSRNISLAGGRSSLLSVCGRDQAGDLLKQLLDKDQVSTDDLIQEPLRTTIKKTRITSSHQQMMRLDWEQLKPITHENEQRLLEALESKSFNCVVVSDYGKGLLSDKFLKRIFSYTQAHHIPTVVDPKGKDFSKYQGCSLITPNRKEAIEALGYEVDDKTFEGVHLAHALIEKYGFEQVLVTMGAAGMTYVSKENPKNPIIKKPKAREVFDVSGAGDTVVALMALGLASKTPIHEAVEIANLGAGIVVEKWGTQPIYAHELEKALANH